MTNHIEIRPLTANEVQIMFQWVYQEGWNPGLNDHVTFHKMAPKGLLGLFIREELIATAGVFLHNSHQAFFGLYIVKPAFRGQGFGLQLTRHRLHMAGQRNIGLDGVIAQIHAYRKAGFRLSSHSIRFELPSHSEPYAPGKTVLDIQSVPGSALKKYIQPMMPDEKPLYFPEWFYQKNAVGLLSIDNQRITGCLLMRPCHKGHKVGPLFADSQKIAMELIQTAFSYSQGSPVYLDVSDNNQLALNLVGKFDAREVFETVRMYKGYKPETDDNRIYGICSMEAG